MSQVEVLYRHVLLLDIHNVLLKWICDITIAAANKNLRLCSIKPKMCSAFHFHAGLINLVFTNQMEDKIRQKYDNHLVVYFGYGCKNNSFKPTSFDDSSWTIWETVEQGKNILKLMSNYPQNWGFCVANSMPQIQRHLAMILMTFRYANQFLS